MNNRFADNFKAAKHVTILFCAVSVVFAAPQAALFLWLITVGMHIIDSLPVRDEE